MNQSLKSEIENYPHIVLIICSWWDTTNNARERDYLTHYSFLHGASIAFSVLGRFELSDEMDILKHVLDTKLHYKFLLDRDLHKGFYNE